jgi:hypothetical protein
MNHPLKSDLQSFLDRLCNDAYAGTMFEGDADTLRDAIAYIDRAERVRRGAASFPQQGGEQTEIPAGYRLQAISEFDAYADVLRQINNLEKENARLKHEIAAVLPQQGEEKTKPREELLSLAKSSGARITGKPDGSEPIEVVFSIDAWRKFDAAVLPQVGEATRKIAEYDANGNWFECHTIDEMQQFYLSRLPAIRESAKACGYAIGLHGSARRDFDLMAMQWTDECMTPDELAHAVAKAACGITREGPYQWEQKPQGRIATSFPICWTEHSANFPKGMLSLGHIDLSIIAAPATLGEAEPFNFETQLQIAAIQLQGREEKAVAPNSAEIIGYEIMEGDVHTLCYAEWIDKYHPERVDTIVRELYAAPVAQALPVAAEKNAGVFCVVCGGQGSLSTGIAEWSSTQCDKCNGTGLQGEKA